MNLLVTGKHPTAGGVLVLVQQVNAVYFSESVAPAAEVLKVGERLQITGEPWIVRCDSIGHNGSAVLANNMRLRLPGGETKNLRLSPDELAQWEGNRVVAE